MPTKLDLLIEDDRPGLTAAVLFDYDHVHHNDEATVVSMLSLTAPEVDIENKRTPLNLVAAIDVSTSMGGDKIRTAKNSLKKLVEYLGPDDRLGIIAFHSSVFEVFPSEFMDGPNKGKATAAINSLQATGWTNFSGALLQAFSMIKGVEGKRGAINRIIMFSDGGPTTGECDPVKILDMLDKAMMPEISVSTFGYGKDYDPELLGEMSKRGNGGHYFVEQIEQCAAMFGTELGGLLSTYAQNIKVEVNLAEGVQLVEYMDSVYSVDGNVITVPDVLGGETKHVLVKVKLPKKGRAVCARPSAVVDYKVIYDHVGDAARRRLEERGQVQYVRKKEDVQQEPDKTVQEQILITEASKTLDRARSLADAGQFDQAREVMDVYLCANAAHLDDGLIGNRISADMNMFRSHTSNARSYSAVRRRVAASSHSYSTRRAAAADDGLWMNEAQGLVSAALSADPGAVSAVVDGTTISSSTSDSTTTSDSSE